MTFEEVLDQAIDILRRRGRVTYRTLQRQFSLDDAALADLKDELIFANPHIADEEGRGLVWIGEDDTPSQPTPPSAPPAQPEATPESQPTHAASPPAAYHTPDAERRQLTVMFCDLADSTKLSGQLDPEDLRDVIRAYQATCVAAIQRFDGYVAQYLGDGLLVYFGYPQAHEDDAQRAVRTGLDLLEAMGTLNTRLTQDKGLHLAVRVGIHTGMVVVGEMGSGDRHEHLALGGTPNMAARLQGLAAPDTVVISDASFRLVQGYFTCQAFGTQVLKGVDTPVQVYQVLAESAAQSRLDVAEATGLTPLVGREAEVTLLRERWAQSQEGLGHLVVLSGEAGIGKSRLVRVLTEQVGAVGALTLTLRCSPYHLNSAFYPVIDHLQRLLHWHREASPAARLATLEQALRTAGLPLEDTVPLLATLLTLPVPERYPPLSLSPQRQKQKTQEALVAWLLAETAQHPVLAVWEDLHWADPSTLELLGLLLDQVPTARLLLVLTARPEFRPPWGLRAHMTQLTLTRLRRQQVEEMVLRVTGGKPLPAEVLAQVVAKTDGIPLFVEELTKTILEAGLMHEAVGGYVLTGPLPPLAIPATLQDALMARLDRLAMGKAVAQLGAVLGREFAYELLHAVAPLDEGPLQQALAQLVEAELLYQRGVPPQATYRFKHALIQDAAYQSLLRSTRQQYHREIAQVLEARFPEARETQPELLAYHYTEAGCLSQAVFYWQRAGQQTLQRSANLEAISHLTKGREVLQTLPDTPERRQQELDMLTMLGPAFIATKGTSAPEVEHVYVRAHELCQQVAETPQIFPILRGLAWVYLGRGALCPAQELGEQFLSLAQRTQERAFVMEAHRTLGEILFWRGEFTAARAHLEDGVALYHPQQHGVHAFLYGRDPGIDLRGFMAMSLWFLGYPDQAVASIQEALRLTSELAHPYSLAVALNETAWLHQCRRERVLTHERAAAVLTLAIEHGLAQRWASSTILLGWTLTEQGHLEEGIAQMRQGLTAWQATGGRIWRPYFLALLAEACAKAGQVEEGLTGLVEALAAVENTGECFYEAELYRLKGECLRRQVANPPFPQEAEASFQQALATAQRQHAKSLELRAAMSLSRLWQQQGRRTDAYDLLAPIYSWFTEGFDTADLQEAKALLEALS